jgi:hypothetical protein
MGRLLTAWRYGLWPEISFFPFFKRAALNDAAGGLEVLLGVIAVAVSWHVGLAVLERHLSRSRRGPSLLRLLLLAEVEVLRALREELKRCRSLDDDEVKMKLSRVEQRLEELGEDGS